MLRTFRDIHYIERSGNEHYHTLHRFPPNLMKKVTLLKYFRNYMKEHLLRTGAAITPREGDDLSRIPALRTWFRTRSAIVLHLTSGILQVRSKISQRAAMKGGELGFLGYFLGDCQFG